MSSMSLPKAALAAVTPEELTKTAELFDTVKQLRIRLSNINEDILNKAFETHIHGVLSKLEKRLPTLSNKNVQTTEIVMAKHGLCDAAFQQIILLCQSISPALGDVLKSIRSMHSQYYTELQRVANDFTTQVSECQTAADQAKEKYLAADEECKKLLQVVEVLDKEAEENHKQILELRSQLRTALADAAAANIEKSAATSFRNTRPPSTPATPYTTNTAPSSLHISTSSVLDTNKSLSASQLGSPKSKSHRQSVNIPQNITSTPWLLGYRADLQRVLDSGKCRVLSLREVKEFIATLYDGKRLANQRCQRESATVPPETMEQYVYRVMEKKYGLRVLSLEHTGNFLISIRHYAESEIDINVFDKIFRNVIDEEFPAVLQELQKSIHDLVMIAIANKSQMIDQSALEKALETKLQSNIEISQWEEIVNYLYNARDSTALRLQLRAAAADYQESLPQPEAQRGRVFQTMNHFQKPSKRRSQSADAKRLGYTRDKKSNVKPPSLPVQRVEMPFTLFMKHVLNFQLQMHETYLNGFRHAFNQHDNDSDGILTQEEFAHCITSLRNSTIEEDGELIDTMLHIMDPNNTNRIVYSAAALQLNRISNSLRSTN